VSIVDAHAHVISRAQQRYPLAPPGGAAPEWLDARAADADDLLERMDSAGVDQAVLVQFVAAHGYDNHYVLDCAGQHPERFVAVCALDGRDASVADRLPECVARGAVGVRLRAPDRSPALDWLECDALWRRTSDLKIPLAVHLQQHQHAAGIPLLRERMRRFSDARVVLDHVGNPPWQSEDPDVGLGLVSQLAEAQNLVVKVATLNFNRLEAAGILAPRGLRRLVGMFGAARVMWGSDFPNTPGDYSEMLARAQLAVAGLPAADQQCILGATAMRVYPALASARVVG
jgi:predicted TIM-barrel fold metal-dependent hydrolase